MPDVLRAIPFDATQLLAARRINCGPDWWCREVAEWIGSADPENSALEDARQGVSVWLYINTANETVGFGSIGTAVWPLPDDTVAEIQVLPVLGLDVRFHGAPVEAPHEERYSNQIMNHLLDVAEQRSQISALVGLIVAAENHKARRFYEKFGFQTYGQSVEDTYERMILRL